jgi:hypothetical protein
MPSGIDPVSGDAVVTLRDEEICGLFYRRCARGGFRDHPEEHMAGRSLTQSFNRLGEIDWLTNSISAEE